MKELEEKDTLTGAEMDELISLRPGTIYAMPDGKIDRLPTIAQALKNGVELEKRSTHAMQHGCFLEVLSLRLQRIEYYLRLFLIGKGKETLLFEESDKRTFGAILHDCSKSGMKADLVEELKDFNSHRVKAIHKYLAGITAYETLQQVSEDSKGLTMKVAMYVGAEVGTPLY